MRIIATILWGIALGLCTVNYTRPSVIVVDNRVPITSPAQTSQDYL